jgi:hypothetical protein
MACARLIIRDCSPGPVFGLTNGRCRTLPCAILMLEMAESPPTRTTDDAQQHARAGVQNPIALRSHQTPDPGPVCSIGGFSFVQRVNNVALELHRANCEDEEA